MGDGVGEADVAIAGGQFSSCLRQKMLTGLLKFQRGRFGRALLLDCRRLAAAFDQVCASLGMAAMISS